MKLDKFTTTTRSTFHKTVLAGAYMTRRIPATQRLHSNGAKR